jgi:hypothetical protein
MFKRLLPRFNNAEIDDNRTHGLIALNTVGSAALAISGLSLSGVGALVVAIVDASGNQITSFGGGTQYTDAAVAPAHPVGPTLIWNNGGTFAAVSAAAPLPVTATFTPSGTQDVNLTKVGGASFALGQQLAAASLPVVLTAAQITTLTPPTSVIVTQGTAANLKAVVDFSGTGLGTVQLWDGSTGVNNRVRLNDSTGASITLGQQLAAASLPVVLTAAQITTLTPLSSVSISSGSVNATLQASSGTDIGKLTANQSVNLTQIAGGAITATNVAITDAPINTGAQAVSAENTVVTAARKVQLVADLVGKLITLPYANPENFVNGTTAAITDTTTTQVLATAGSGVRNYITAIIVTNSHATVGTFVKITDGASTILWEGYAAPAGGGFTISLPVALRGTANTAVNAICVTTGANVIVSANGYKGV